MSAGRRARSSPEIALQAIPAAPGYFVVSPVFDESRAEVFRAPVIAWALELGSFQPYPITLDGIDANTPSILQPDGTVERLGLQSYPSVAEWLEDILRKDKV